MIMARIEIWLTLKGAEIFSLLLFFVRPFNVSSFQLEINDICITNIYQSCSLQVEISPFTFIRPLTSLR